MKRGRFVTSDVLAFGQRPTERDVQTRVREVGTASQMTRSRWPIMSTDDFRERFAQRFGLKSSADCERALLWKTRYPVARFMAPVMEAFWPSLFRQDRELVSKIAAQSSIDGVRTLVDFFKAQQSYESSFLRGTLRLRVSGRRVMSLANEVFTVSGLPQPRQPEPPGLEAGGKTAPAVTLAPKGQLGGTRGAKKGTPAVPRRGASGSSKPN